MDDLITAQEAAALLRMHVKRVQQLARDGKLPAVTKSGTNRHAGSVFAYTRNEALSAPTDYLGRSRDLRQSEVWQMGGSLGGPIVRDRVHYFLAFDRQQSNVPLTIADLRTPQDEIDAQIVKDSLDRFLDILTRRYGVPPGTPMVGIFSRRPIANTVFGRLDWQFGDRHHVTLRDNVSTSDGPNDGVGDQPIAVIESRSSSESIDNQTLLSLRSSLTPSLSNELKLGFSLADRSLAPNTYIPRGFVRVRSTLPNGTTGDVRLQFGGNRLAPEASGERQYQLVNTAYWQHGKQLVTAGVENSLTYLRTFIPTDEGGLFEFDSLGAFENQISSRYTRQVPLEDAPYARQSVLDLGAFAQTEWRPTPAIVAMLGLRYDVTSFLTPATRNEMVEQKLGLRTDNTPTDWNGIQPRAQLTWDTHADGRDVVRIGAGAFTAQPHYYLQANNMFFDGTQLSDLTLTGAAVPRPDYVAYRSSLGTVPGVPNAANAPAYVNIMGADFRAPVTWKASAAYSRRVTKAFTLTGTFLAAETRHNYSTSTGTFAMHRRSRSTTRRGARCSLRPTRSRPRVARRRGSRTRIPSSRTCSSWCRRVARARGRRSRMVRSRCHAVARCMARTRSTAPGTSRRSAAASRAQRRC